MKYRPDIDGLRAVAVVPVVLYHAGVTAFSGGFVGVDVFFVISGYLITRIIKDEIDADRFSLLGFYERRVRRILPAFFAMAGACLIAGWFLLLPDDYALLGKSALAAMLFASNIFFWHQSTDYFAGPADENVLLHTWSLAVEEQFYVFFPLFLLVLVLLARHLPGRFGLKLKAHHGNALIGGVIVLGGLVSLALAAWGVVYMSVATFYWLPMRAWELMIGAVLAVEGLPMLKRRAGWLGQGLAAAGLALIVYSVFVYTRETPFPGLAALAPTVGAGLIIYAGLGGQGHPETWVAKILAGQPARFIGLISYSLYLWHWPLIVFYKYYTGLVRPEPVATVVLVAVSMVMATLSWWYVERPFRDRRRWSRGPIFTAAAAAAVVVLAAGGGLSLSLGVPGRVPAQVAELADWKRHMDPEADRCHQAYTNHISFENLCVRGATGVAPSFVLIGDSHGGAMAPGVFAAAKQEGRAGIQLTQMGWRMLKPYVSLTSAANSASAPEKYMNAMFERVMAEKNIKEVIYVGYFRQALERTYQKGDLSATPIDGVTAVRNGLEALVTRYPSVTFVFVPEVPQSRLFGSHQEARAAMFGRRFDPKITRADYDRQLAQINGLFDGLKGHGNAQVLSLEDSFCDYAYCYGARMGKTIYRDDNHVTAEFATTLKSVFAQKFSSAALRD